MQPRTSQDAFNELQTFQKSRRKSQDVLRESENRLGLPTATQRQAGLRAAITNTENLIRSVEPSVAGRTSGSLVNEAQKTRLIGLERAPLDESFREQSRAFEGESANINELKRQALTDAQLAIAEDDTRQNTLKGLYEALYQREQEERAFAEQQRQFNEQLALSKRAASGGSGLASLLSGGGGLTSGGGAPAADPTKQKAMADVGNLFKREGQKSFFDEITAIYKSANYGNTYDKAKLELIKAKIPQFFKKNGAPKYVAF